MGNNPDVSQSELCIPLALVIGSGWSNQREVKSCSSQLGQKISFVQEVVELWACEHWNYFATMKALSMPPSSLKREPWALAAQKAAQNKDSFHPHVLSAHLNMP